MPNHPTTALASGAINQSGDFIEIVLVQPADGPSVIMIRWPDAPTITPAARYNEVASTAMRLLAEASTMLARIKQASGCDYGVKIRSGCSGSGCSGAPKPGSAKTSFKTAYFQAARSAAQRSGGMMIKINKLAGAFIAAGALLAVTAPAAHAAPPESFTITENIDFNSEEPPTFDGTGPLCTSGTFEDEVAEMFRALAATPAGTFGATLSHVCPAYPLGCS